MEKRLILIVEDHPSVSWVFTRALQDLDYEIETIPDGQSALNRLKQAVPDLLLLDLHLPYVSGEEILRQVKADARFTSTYVVLMTADVVAYDRLADDPQPILLKPITMQSLRDLVSKLSPI
ncbi:MAG: response regulator [Anaerolineales bacterium]|nr:response regulator [Anaerolineales bacterium]